ncbi:MAG: hypothetical protein JWQ35_143 [Bacteriovoracaceae bacterium]|nr:hypothetical protein [Bacteriovoracaceae bacterium]
MDRGLKWRIGISLLIWLPLAFFSGRYAVHHFEKPRFEFLLSSTGIVSTLQREDWLQSAEGVQPQDLILSVNGAPFDYIKIRDWLSSHSAGDQRLDLKIKRKGRELTIPTYLKRFSKNDLLTLFLIPFLLSIVFLGFGFGVSSHKELRLKSWEAVETFSTICLLVSLFFLILLPATTLGIPFSFSVLLPLLGVLVMHLFLVYPKHKGSKQIRYSVLGLSYGALLVIGIIRATGQTTALGISDLFVQNLGVPTMGICFLVALGSLGNTLLTSRDFWARRRARLLSLVVLLSFISAISLFWAFIWESPHISLERVLSISLIFPTAFAVIFLKENVFNLERMFRRGLHQLLLLGMAVTLAILVGLSWSQWRLEPGREWMLWMAIAVVVIAVTRPAGSLFENTIHKWIQTKVRYPKVAELFENASSLCDFLSELSRHFESHLNMKNITFAFFQDPTQLWKATNEQVWRFHDRELTRSYSEANDLLYSSVLYQGQIPIGEIRFDGGDSLAFDPYTSPDWAGVVRDIARCLEILCLREFIAIQQSYLAVGRMQSLLAHQMKNPLAIIKVCAGLLNSRIREDEEGEELIKTIQGEVGRVSAAIQGVFEHSSRTESRQRIHLGSVLAQVKENALARFPKCEFEISYWSEKSRDDTQAMFGIWIEKEGLRQALSNLVVNAFEAGSTWVGIEVHFSSKEFSLIVKDRGPGLHEKIDLFKPFVTTKSHGTGLGLAHVKAFMDRSSGQIKVQSKRGEGTTFVLEFSKQFVMNDSL